MGILPNQIKQRNDLDCRLGIKSSLSNIASVVALTYVLYRANNKSSEIVYAEEVLQPNGKKKLILKEEYKKWIIENFAVKEDTLENNPLLTSQLEALQVGLSLMFRLAKISYVDFPNVDTKERTGGERFRKTMKFAINIKLVDVFISSWDDADVKVELSNWLNNNPSNTKISQGLKQMLTSFAEETQFKIRNKGQEIIFQQDGIYQAVSENNSVIGKDDQEDVGPFRVFKSFVREGLHPFLSLANNEFSSFESEEFLNYKGLVNTGLELLPKRTIVYQEIPEVKEPNEERNTNSRQIIYYGAPGTGKSYKVKKKAKNENSIRTTFHPDSDYSTFVGAYKPTMDKKPLYGLFGDKTIRYKDGDDLSEDTISYKFIPQAFLKAYCEAWRRWSKGNEEPYYLVIEEINRGNCAQIFGDLFQLLDRDPETGFSTYAIEADDDIRRFISEDKEGKLKREKEDIIVDVIDKDGDTIATGEEIEKGKKLVLPPNLYLLATMNTSDQSLFPIDSAFKRRWDWEYVPIEYKNESWWIEIGEEKYSWVSFQKEINKRIFEETDSEDKKLGDYFVVAMGDKITEETFKNKVLFYLWNDVFKDGESDVFKINDKERFSFSEFYDKASGKQNLLDFMEKLGVEKL